MYQGVNGVFFVSSERCSWGDDRGTPYPRKYTVRTFDPATGEVDRNGELGEHADLESAQDAAKAAAGGNPATVAGRMTEISSVEHWQTVEAPKHLPNATPGGLQRLISLARRHHKLQEDACNGEVPEDHDADNEAAITRLAVKMGAKAVHFSGDPRGCTVKLVCSDGYTDDWGREGFCVPQHA